MLCSNDGAYRVMNPGALIKVAEELALYQYKNDVNVQAMALIAFYSACASRLRL